MKRILLFLFMIAIAISFSVCFSVAYPKFTSSERLCNLKTGQKYDKVVTELGCQPYDLLSKQDDGFDIYMYKYKVLVRKINAKKVNNVGRETDGKEVYTGRVETAFLIFNKGKLETVVTANGRTDAPRLIMLNNTMYQIAKDKKGQYTIVPTYPESLIFPYKSKSQEIFSSCVSVPKTKKSLNIFTDLK